MVDVIGDILIDGKPAPPEQAAVSVRDIGFQRGYGCFEALRCYRGRVFRIGAHLDRLAASAATMGLPAIDVAAVAEWITDRAEQGGDCVVRVFVTGGVDPTDLGREACVVVLAESLPPQVAGLRIQPRSAPWHPSGEWSELTGAKTLSYGPNLAASLAARRAGYDDALLIGRDGTVLEGPTFGIAWVRAGALETPALDLGILASITRQALIEVAKSDGLAVREGGFPLERVLTADEVLAMSTVKEVVSVTGVGTHQVAAGPVTAALADAFRRLAERESAG
jgi:branched-chain amino acid aminotransferase